MKAGITSKRRQTPFTLLSQNPTSQRYRPPAEKLLPLSSCFIFSVLHMFCIHLGIFKKIQWIVCGRWAVKECSACWSGFAFPKQRSLALWGEYNSHLLSQKSFSYCSQSLKVSVVFPKVEHASRTEQPLVILQKTCFCYQIFCFCVNSSEHAIPESASHNWVQVVTEKITFAALFHDNCKNNLSSS